MDRLLFAAARGARSQTLVDVQGKCMCTNCGTINTFESMDRMTLDENMQLVIHPKDEHLQYGPISSALREIAETGKDPHTLSSMMALNALRYECDPYVAFGALPESDHLQWFLLILSEAFADMGL